MNKTFEFNTKDRLELREMFYREQSSMANNFIDRIEQIVSERITPEQDTIKPYHEHGNSVASDSLNESITVMLRKNAELEKELEYAKIR